jgi:hypothetical protein
MNSFFKFFREGPGGAPRDFETIRRSIIRKLFGLDDRRSNPLLSGDSFKFISSQIYEGNSFQFPEDLANLKTRNDVVFVQGWPVSPAAKELAYFCMKGLVFPRATLIVHNCDVIPDYEEMAALAKSFNKVYSVNWLGDPQMISPLPIGLENRDKRRNGVPKDYIKEIRRGLPNFEKRDIDFLVCFSMHTNKVEREKALSFAQTIPGSFVVSEPITPKAYRKLLLRSKYVVSPPGNGPDCHRTWEAMYLGAIPVVKRESWPFRHLDLPVVQINSWSELQHHNEWPLPNMSTEWQSIGYWFKE